MAATPAGSVRKLASIISYETERLTKALQAFDGAQFDPDSPPQAIRLEVIVSHMRQLLGARRVPEQLTIREQFANPLPRVNGDPHRLGHALFNVVSNAIESLGD